MRACEPAPPRPSVRDRRRGPAVRVAVELSESAHCLRHLRIARRVERQRAALEDVHPALRVARVRPVADAVLQTGLDVVAVLLVAVGTDDGRREVVRHGRGDDQSGIPVAGFAHPTGQFRIGAAALQDRIRADQLKFVEQDHPARVAGAFDEFDGEGQTLRRQIGRLRRPEGIAPQPTDIPKTASEPGHPQLVAGPEGLDLAFEFVVVACLVNFEACREHCVQAVAVGGTFRPPSEVPVGVRIDIHAVRQLLDEPALEAR